MKSRLLLILIVALLAIPTLAQERKITGTLTDKESKEPIEQATVQLLRSDSTYVAGALTDEKGSFSLQAPSGGKFILKVTSVGYASLFRSVSVEEDKDLSVGRLVMSADAIMLKEAKITGQAVKVILKKDTFIYNASAYRTPEGSVIEELVKRLPGAKIDDDGKITINGKEVKKIMVDGKEFMTGDTKTAMKNLPTSIVEKVKAYDQKSDLARMTGIDDGEETTVLDFGLKKGMNKGMFSNIDLSYGTHDRYAEKLMGAYFNSNNRFMLFGNANNVNDMGFPGGGGRGGFGRGRNGLNTAKMIGFNYNYEKKNKLKIDFSGRWNHNDGDAFSRTSAENFVSTSGSFSNSVSQNYSRSNNLNFNGRIEWNPDTMTTIMLRPNFSWSANDGLNLSTSASFNEDPYTYVSDPLDDESLELMSKDKLVVNSQNNNSINYNTSRNWNGTLMLNRKLNSKGRNVTVRFNGGYNNSDGNNLSSNTTHLWLKQNAAGLDSTYQTNRYSLTPTDNYNYQITATYSEPIFKGAFLQFRYSYKYSHSKSDRSTFDFSNLTDGFFKGLVPRYRGWGDYLNMLPNPLEDYRDKDLSRYSEYNNYINEFNLTFRLIRKKFRMNAGFMVQPQSSKYVQDYQGLHVDTTRNVVNVSPTFDLRYRFSNQHNLRINYRGTTSQPSMSQLLDITDDSNPLNISKGNPGLKPSFTNNMHIDYSNYIQNHMKFINAGFNFSTTRNSISNKVTYDEITGGCTTQPENINGNWHLNGRVMYNMAVDTLGRWNVSTETSVDLNNSVGYLSIDRTSDSQKNRTRATTVGQGLSGSYRNEWFELSLDGSLDYTHARNKLQSQSNLDTWRFNYGATFTLNTPWGTGLSTGIHEQSRRGYNDNSLNTNELIWNAQISQSFLKGKPLSVMLQFYDLLHNQSNFSRSIDAMSRRDVEYNSINSYAMLHVVYRFNLFGGKNARQGMRGGGPEREFRGRGGNAMPAMPMGGGFPSRGGFPRGGRF